MSTTKNRSRKIHEEYHKSTRPSYKIINDNNFTYRHIISTINEQLNSGQKEILDIGCGAGTLSFYYASKGHSVTGIDISSKAISSCLQTAKQLGINNAKFQKMDFPKEFDLNRNYDLIIFTEVIEHLEDDNLALRKIRALLRSNGLLVVSTPSTSAPLHRLGLTKEFDKEVGHLRRYSQKQLTSLLTKNGYKVIKIKKVEGIFRNFLFINPTAGQLVRFLKHSMSDWATFVDNLTIKLFGESNYIVVAVKK